MPSSLKSARDGRVRLEGEEWLGANAAGTARNYLRRSRAELAELAELVDALSVS